MDDYADTLAALTAVERELSSLPADDFARRHRLLTERDRLRTRIGELQEGSGLSDERPTPQIQREIDALRATAASLQKHRIDLVKQAGGGRTNEMGNQGGFQLNQKIDEATGFNRIQQRISRLEAILEDRANAGAELTDPDS